MKRLEKDGKGVGGLPRPDPKKLLETLRTDGLPRLSAHTTGEPGVPDLPNHRAVDLGKHHHRVGGWSMTHR